MGTQKSVVERAFGEGIRLFGLRGKGGLELDALDYGGTVQSLRVPCGGRVIDICLGFASPEAVRANPYFGQLIGRYANRIAGGRFALDGQEYVLAQNNGPNCLHGGRVGWNDHMWRCEALEDGDDAALKLSLSSPAGEEGFPGTVEASVVYRLTPDNVWRIEYEAVTDAPTPINLTQHIFFNLNGEGAGDTVGHELEVFAETFTPTDEVAIPTGELRAVRGTPFDFTAPHLVGERIDAADEQLKIGRGYDHNFVLNNPKGDLARAARVTAGGLGLEVWTTEPGVQLYTGNWIAEGTQGKSVYGARAGMCLETQHYPDSPNQPEFPSCILRPGERYRSVTEFRFFEKGVA